MTVTFRIDKGFTIAVPPATIEPGQLAVFVSTLHDTAERHAMPLIHPGHGTIEGATFSLEVRVCPLALAVVTAPFDHDPAVIAVVDEAQYLGRRIRIHRDRQDAPILLELADNPDASPPRNLGKGSEVIIRPAMFPMQAWHGRIVGTTKHGFSVIYTAFGVTNRQTFSARELTLA